MKVIVKEPWKDPEVKEIDNTLKAMQEIVGGYIECLNDRIPTTALICCETGKLIGMDPNIYYNGDLIVGTLIIVGTTKNGEFKSLNNNQVALFMSLLTGYSLLELDKESLKKLLL